MKRLAFLPLVLALSFCAGSRGSRSGTTAQPGHGALAIEVVPNPIVAQRVSGNTYDFPFDVVIRETGGRSVTVDRVTAEVFALDSIRIAEESYDASRIAGLGYPTTIPAGGTLRYHFAPRREVPDERLFGGVRADLRVEGHDDAGAATTARTSVTVTR